MADTGYLVGMFPASLICFPLLIIGFAFGAGTLVIGIGFASIALTLMIARGFAEVERNLLPGVLGYPVAHPSYPKAPEGAGFVRRMFTVVRSGQRWLDLLYGILIFPVSIVTFVLAVALFSAVVIALTYPLYGWILRVTLGEEYTDLPHLLGLGDSHLVSSIFYVTLGLILVFVWLYVVRGCALVRAHLGRVLLTTVGEMQERIADLSESRAAAVSAEAGALRRLERDIHDGPQQRLVHLAMELSRAQRQLSKDPNAAGATLTDAIAATRDTLEELRALSRGIAPPILTDRGLSPALAALASRCTVPVGLDISVEGRFPPAVENTVYFVAAESLTNIAKHSGAERATLSLSRDGNRLVLTILDDGVGGAHTSKGHGLGGLTDRVRAVEGGLVVDSPPGGPTVIAMEVPCE